MGDSLAIGFCWFAYAFVDFVSLRSISRTIWHLHFFVALYTFSSVIALSFLLAFKFLVYHCCRCSQNTPYIAVYYIPYVRLECIK